ncbi:6922_t:CDS:2, partial [Entrophospora sp. SA101]
PGQSYLKSMLSERINNLIEHKDLNLEINPLQVYEQVVKKYEEENGFLPPDLPRSVTTEVAAANPEVMKIIQPRMKMLIEIANKYGFAAKFTGSGGCIVGIWKGFKETEDDEKNMLKNIEILKNHLQLEGFIFCWVTPENH